MRTAIIARTAPMNKGGWPGRGPIEVAHSRQTLLTEGGCRPRPPLFMGATSLQVVS
jgi:hypothetical protein